MCVCVEGRERVCVCVCVHCFHIVSPREREIISSFRNCKGLLKVVKLTKKCRKWKRKEREKDRGEGWTFVKDREDQISGPKMICVKFRVLGWCGSAGVCVCY